jgi:hypothetical protein
VRYRTEGRRGLDHYGGMQNAANHDPKSMSKTGVPYLFRVFHDKSRSEGHELDDAQIAYEYAQFSVALARHYERWPGVEASCLEQPPPDSGLLVQLKSDLPADAIHNSLSELLVFLNQQIVASRIGHPSFVMQQLNDKSPQPLEWPKG